MTREKLASHNANLAPTSMEGYRAALFRAHVVRRMQAGKALGQSPGQVASVIAREQRALALALSDPDVVNVAANVLRQSQATILANARYQNTPEQAHEAMQQILRRRAAEAEQFAASLAQPDAIAMLAAMTPEAADASIPALRNVKMHEVLGDLLHLENGAPQVIAHIDAAAKGAMFEHEALAQVFATDGALHHALMLAMARALPQADQSEIPALVSDWLSARENAAKITAELSANDGAAYLEAVRCSTEWHRQSHAAAPLTTIQTSGLQHYLSPRELEKEKTDNQRAEDIAYTTNHALSCGTTDIVLQPLIAAAFGVNIGCDDSNHKGHDHQHAKPKLTLKTFAHEAGHYLKGEIIGDFIAVPLTILVQRMFPNFMESLRKILEPLAGWAFRGGAKHAAKHWAKKQGLDTDAPEVQAHADSIYQHEIAHLPQAAVWNMFAYPIGAVAQKISGHGRSYPEIFKSKLVGAVVSNSILIGGRMLAPAAAQQWDAMMSKNVLLPVSKKVGKLFGVDEKTMEKAMQKPHEQEAHKWAQRVEDDHSAYDKPVGMPAH